MVIYKYLKDKILKQTKRKCIICGKYFFYRLCYSKRGGNVGKCCSYKCRGVFFGKILAIKYKSLRKEKERIKEENKLKKIKIYNKCKFCQKKTLKLFCNKKCYHNYRKKNMGITAVTINCKNCGKQKKITAGQYNAGQIYCSIGCGINYRIKNKKHTVYGNCRGGKREDLNNQYFRSRWEANYARYLNFLIKIKQIEKWEFESETFVFDKIRHGTTMYIPDFKIYYTNGKIEYHEIKGYMNPKSKTKLKRMTKYYPDKKIILIGTKEYRNIYNKMRGLIPNWEVNKKKSY